MSKRNKELLKKMRRRGEKMGWLKPKSQLTSDLVSQTQKIDTKNYKKK